MNQIPDAPWIRDAEQNGYPSDEPVYCTECGEECETVYVDFDGHCFGCNNCLKAKDAWEWFQDRKEANRPDWDDE